MHKENPGGSLQPLRRRDVIAMLGGAAVACPIATRAQQGAKIRRVGVLFATTPETVARNFETFQAALRSLGWTEGSDVQFERRYAGNDQSRLPALAAELVLEKVDVIVANSTAATRAARNSTSRIPIVMVGVSDPIGSGFASSLARPGGNTTGVAILNTELAPKQLEILKALVPHAKRIAILQPDVSYGSGELTMAQLSRAAGALDLELISARVKNSAELSRLFDELLGRADAYFVIDGPGLYPMRVQIAVAALDHRLPGIAQRRDYVEVGMLISYGADIVELLRHAASYVDKILRGSDPANLPIEQPNKFELFINLKTAKALAITVPQSILARADELIE